MARGIVSIDDDIKQNGAGRYLFAWNRDYLLYHGTLNNDHWLHSLVRHLNDEELVISAGSACGFAMLTKSDWDRMLLKSQIRLATKARKTPMTSLCPKAIARLRCSNKWPASEMNTMNFKNRPSKAIQIPSLLLWWLIHPVIPPMLCNACCRIFAIVLPCMAKPLW